jgi:hypothetical protein
MTVVSAAQYGPSIKSRQESGISALTVLEILQAIIVGAVTDPPFQATPLVALALL